jgi:hypothetical protein
MLIVLWSVSIVLIIGMLNDWGTDAKSNGKEDTQLSLDKMLLSFGELEAEKNTTFINLQLKDAIQDDKVGGNEEATIHKRKELYNKILERKIEAQENEEKEDGFSIKPVPQ